MPHCGIFLLTLLLHEHIFILILLLLIGLTYKYNRAAKIIEQLKYAEIFLLELR